MTNANKVEFGMSQVHVGTFVEEGGIVVLGEPMHIPGAVGLTLEADSELYQFFADDTVYYSDYSDNGETGELTMALFPDEFKTTFLSFVKLDDGGIAKVKGGQSESMYLAFQGKGDKNNRRHILYNVSPGSITREYRTIEGTKEVLTEVLPTTITGDNTTGILKVSYSEGDEGYEALFETPTAPRLPTATPEA